MRDKKGFLPAHVACSRHCSPEKLKMLLQVNPASLFAETDDGRTLLVLAKSTATKSHPNYALISEIEKRVKIASASASPSTVMGPFNAQASFDHGIEYWNQGITSFDSHTGSATHNVPPLRRQRKPKRKRKVTKAVDKETHTPSQQEGILAKQEGVPIKQDDVPIKRKDCESANQQEDSIPIKQEDSEPASLLLHFSRHMENITAV
jgi:hypothetical protein